MSAVSMIARKLNIRLSKATSGCCGLKDKGALTCQKVTINSQQASSDLTALMGLNKQLEGIKIADVELVDRMLRYGEHSGNRFTILLRNITVSNSRVFDAVKRLRRFGFVNYFGHQRFGTGPVPSTEVGRLLLGKRWREAGEEVMSTKYIRRCHSAGEAKARQIFVEQGNASAALDVLPFTCEDERCILEAFATSRNVNESLRQAFSKLARADLWRQAYTSLVWNRMATKRLMEYDRRKAVVGDLVAVKRYDKTFVDVVKEEDVAAGRYSIAQVVLPVFARNKKLLFPKNAVGSSARASLQADGLSFEEVDLEASKAPFPLDDSVCPMRFLIMNCSNLSMKVVTYRSPADVLYDEMLDSHLNSTQGGSGQGKSKSKRAQEQQLPFKGLILSFSLPPNSFATMAVREITREGTHPSVHDAFRDEVLQRNADDAQAGERRSGLQPVKKQHKGNRRTERRKKLRRKAAISRELVKRRKRREPAKSIRRK
uniref:TRUD domain-containing protein n=1 Tax=Guillardia theta TaxID=55529 RepID=A0A7S4NX46_GUITH